MNEYLVIPKFDRIVDGVLFNEAYKNQQMFFFKDEDSARKAIHDMNVRCKKKGIAVEFKMLHREQKEEAEEVPEATAANE